MRFTVIPIIVLLCSMDMLGSSRLNESNEITTCDSIIYQDVIDKGSVKKDVCLYPFSVHIIEKHKSSLQSVNPFDIVQHKSNIDFLRFLNEQGDNTRYLQLKNKHKKSLLEWSIIHKKGHIAHLLVLKSSEQDLTGRCDQDGNNMAHLAAHDGMSMVFDALEEKTFDWSITEKNIFIEKIIKHKNNIDETPLFRAIRSNDYKTIQYLLQYYTVADLNCKNKWGQTALMVAALYQRNYVSALLIAKGADAAIVDSQGNSFKTICDQNELIS